MEYFMAINGLGTAIVEKSSKRLMIFDDLGNVTEGYLHQFDRLQKVKVVGVLSTGVRSCSVYCSNRSVDAVRNFNHSAIDIARVLRLRYPGVKILNWKGVTLGKRTNGFLFVFGNEVNVEVVIWDILKEGH